MARLVIGTNKASNAAAIVKAKPTAMPLSLQLSKSLDGKIVRSGALIDFDDTTNISLNGLAYLYWHNSAISGAIDLSNFTYMAGERGCYYTFDKCINITSVNFSSLLNISGYYGCCHMFSDCTSLTSVDLSSLGSLTGSGYNCVDMFVGCTHLANIDLSSLTTISAQSSCSEMFYGCTSLTSINLSSLTTISGNNGCYYMFTNCSNLASIDLSSLTTLTGSNALKETFKNCTSLAVLSFPSLTSTSFGSYTNQFYRMLYGVTGCTVHFPSNLQSVIGSWSDVTDGFGGTSTIISFDLPATS